MNKTQIYILESKNFTGFVLFEFDASGYLVKYDTSEAELNEQQKVWLLHKLPRHVNNIKAVLKNSRGAKFTRQETKDVTFDMFWDRYNHKSVSSKHVSNNIWKKMSQAERDRAFHYIKTYKRNLPPGIGLKYAETYLRQKLWKN